MSELIEKIISRRSVRAFKSDMPPKDAIDKIINAGLYAPSGMNTQSPIIIAVTDRKTRDRLSKMNAEIMCKDIDPFYNAPVVLVVLADKSVRTHVYDGSLVMGSLMLAAHDLGLASCWIHRAKEEFESDEGKQLLKSLGLTGEYEGIGHCIIGYADGDYPQLLPRKENRVFYIE